MAAVGFDGDHLHLVIVIPPRYSKSGVMDRLLIKGLSETEYSVVIRVFCQPW